MPGLGGVARGATSSVQFRSAVVSTTIYDITALARVVDRIMVSLLHPRTGIDDHSGLPVALFVLCLGLGLHTPPSMVGGETKDTAEPRVFVELLPVATPDRPNREFVGKLLELLQDEVGETGLPVAKEKDEAQIFLRFSYQRSGSANAQLWLHVWDAHGRCLVGLRRFRLHARNVWHPEERESEIDHSISRLVFSRHPSGWQVASSRENDSDFLFRPTSKKVRRKCLVQIPDIVKLDRILYHHLAPAVYSSIWKAGWDITGEPKEAERRVEIGWKTYEGSGFYTLTNESPYNVVCDIDVHDSQNVDSLLFARQFKVVPPSALTDQSLDGYMAGQAGVEFARHVDWLAAALEGLNGTSTSFKLAADDRFGTDYSLWTDNSGRFRLRAMFVGYISGRVKLEKLNGNSIEVPIDKLSESCQARVRRGNR